MLSRKPSGPPEEVAWIRDNVRLDDIRRLVSEYLDDNMTDLADRLLEYVEARRECSAHPPITVLWTSAVALLDVTSEPQSDGPPILSATYETETEVDVDDCGGGRGRYGDDLGSSTTMIDSIVTVAVQRDADGTVHLHVSGWKLDELGP